MKSFIVSLFCVATLSLHVGCCGVRMANSCGRAGLMGDCGVGCDSGCDSGCDVGCRLGGIRSRIASRLQTAHCNSGCGEVYWDEQINERPVCDPCGCSGEFVGGSSCDRCPGGLHRLRQLWGFQYTPSNCSTCSSVGTSGCGQPGCSSCGGDHSIGSHVSSGATPVHSMKHANSQPIESTTRARSRTEPTPASRPVSGQEESTEQVEGEPTVMVMPRSNQRIEVGSGRRTTPTTAQTKLTVGR